MQSVISKIKDTNYNRNMWNQLLLYKYIERFNKEQMHKNENQIYEIHRG